MKSQEDILNQFKDSLGSMAESFSAFSKQFQEISIEAEKQMTEPQKAIINEFKSKAAKLKGGDIAALIKLKSIYEQKIKDAV